MVGGNGNSRGIYTVDKSESAPAVDTDFHITTHITWTMNTDGNLMMLADIVPSDTTVVLPRAGFSMQVPDAICDSVSYYGRGPLENYNDRKSSQLIGVYNLAADEMFTNYTRPQSNGNREDVKWLQLSGPDGKLTVETPETMSVTVSPYTEMELFNASHPYQLPASDRRVVHLDAKVTGLGGCSCGQGGPLPEDRATGAHHRLKVIFY